MARLSPSQSIQVAGKIGPVIADIVQAAIVAFYAAIAYSMRIPIGFAELAVIVPITLIVQMLPVSMNGFGVREATFGFYFTRLGLPLESALLVSFMGAALILLFSLSGGVTYLMRHAGRAQAGFSGVLAEEYKNTPAELDAAAHHFHYRYARGGKPSPS